MPQDKRALNSPPTISTSWNVPFRNTFYLGVCKDACIKTFPATVLVPVKTHTLTSRNNSPPRGLVNKQSSA